MRKIYTFLLPLAVCISILTAVSISSNKTSSEYSFADSFVSAPVAPLSGSFLAGATLQILTPDETVIAEWISGSNSTTINALLLPGETYILRELHPPAGYVTAPDLLFTVPEDGSICKLTMYDDYTKLLVRKLDSITRKDLPGAELVLKDTSGNPLFHWTSTEQGVYLPAMLTAGETYIVEELLPPPGYVSMKEPITFRISDNGLADVIYIENAPTMISVKKLDSTNRAYLSGAMLQLLTEDNELIEEWTSQTEDHLIVGTLEVGKRYLLREISPPTGYKQTEDISFVVEDTDTVQTITIYNDPLPPSETRPETGESGHITILLCLFLSVSLLIGIRLFYFLRKNNNINDSFS